MNKKSILLMLPFLFASATSKSFEPVLSFGPLLSELERLWEKRDRATEEYIASKIATGKSYDDLIQEIKENKDNQGVVALLVLSLTHRVNQEIKEQSQDEKKKELADRLSKDLNALALIMQVQGNKNSDDMTREEYEKEVKPFLCNRLFANKTPQQIEQEVQQEMKQAPSNLMQTVIFGKAKHCDCVKDDWEAFLAKHNIEIKKN